MKIIVTDEVSAEGLAFLTQEPRIQLDVKLGLNKEELLAIIGDYDVIITRSGTTVDKAAAGRRQETEDGGPGRGRHRQRRCGLRQLQRGDRRQRPVRQHQQRRRTYHGAAAGILPQRHQANTSLKSGEWKRAPFTGYELKGKTAGVIGMGKVGGRVATRLKAFECEVLACDPYIAVKRAHDLGVKLVSHDEIYKNCDIITVHTPLNDETTGMIGAREFGLMKSGVIILNVARGGIIDEQALLDNLELRQGGRRRRSTSGARSRPHTDIAQTADRPRERWWSPRIWAPTPSRRRSMWPSMFPGRSSTIWMTSRWKTPSTSPASTWP